jgi:hypothetical protein
MSSPAFHKVDYRSPDVDFLFSDVLGRLFRREPGRLPKP